MNTIIVTGGLGYIGSHTVVELLQKGYEVVVIDNLSNSSEDVIDGIRAITKKSFHFLNADIRDYDELEKAFGYYQRDTKAVVHFAACKSVGESMKHPSKYYDNNVAGTNNLLMVMKHFDVKNLIFSSSCTVYGQADELPITEKTPQKPAESVYGRTKQINEQMITDFHIEHDFNSILLRYFNPIGAHETALIGELPNGVPDNLIPYVTQTASGKRKELTVFGTDYDTPDGTCIRDYIHVVDLAKSHVLAMDFLINNPGKHAFNVGTGIGVSVLDAIKAFEKTNNLSINYSIGPRRSGDIEQIYANSSLVKAKLGWEAKESLEQAMKSAWDWGKRK